MGHAHAAPVTHPSREAATPRSASANRSPRAPGPSPLASNRAPEEREAESRARELGAGLPDRVRLPLSGPLDPANRARFEGRLGADLSRVRIFRDELARSRAEQLHAAAFTEGQNIFFGRRFPGTMVPSTLLAHELVHTVQPGAATTIRAEDDWGFTDFLWEVVAGDFVEDASISATVVRALIGLIPYADQVLDVEDLIANLVHIFWEERYDEVMLWVALVLTAIGAIPELGSAIKGTAKSVLKALKGVGLDDVLTWMRKLGLIDGLQSGIKRIEDLLKKLPELTGQARDTISDMLRRISEGLGSALSTAGSLISNAWRTRLTKLKKAIDDIRPKIAAKVEEAVLHLRKQLAELIARLRGRRVKAPANKSVHSVGAADTIPKHYADDPAFGALSHDPAHNASTRASDLAKGRREAMAGLEAAELGHLKKPITRDPSGAVEFFDANGHGFDVKTPVSPRPDVKKSDANWNFADSEPWLSAQAELRKPPVKNPKTQALEPRNLIIDVTYLTPEDYALYWKKLVDVLTPEELGRVVAINVKL